MERVEHYFLELGPPALTPATGWIAASAILAALYFSGLRLEALARIDPTIAPQLAVAALCGFAEAALRLRHAAAAPLIAILCMACAWQATEYRSAAEGISSGESLETLGFLVALFTILAGAVVCGLAFRLLATGALRGLDKD
ncbi:MAG: hypothetical protein KTR21_13595 [Rhodobacteraceae bacterium]|nr:hypothetical protein [Paracoccaceae bacterium]